MATQVKIISEKQLQCGEGPHWDEKTQSLYFVDIPGCSLNKYDSKTGLHTQAKVSDAVSVIIPVKNEPNKFLVTVGCTLATVVWDGVSEAVSDFKVLLELDGNADMKTNDGKVSPSGVLFVGTMTRKLDFNNLEEVKGHLYSVKNLQAKRLLGDILISNGLAWSHDESTLYFIDSGKFKVVSFQYDKASTEISNEKTVFDFKENNVEGLPDGMTIDTDGNLWVACYDGSQVLNIDPREGKLLKSVKLPARFITSVAFGGPNLEDLYVTSGRGEGPNAHLSKAEDGCTFVITGTGARGLPATPIEL